MPSKLKSTIPGNRICTGCSSDLPENEDYFHRQGKKADGSSRFAAKCKTCCKKLKTGSPPTTPTIFSNSLSKDPKDIPIIASKPKPWANIVLPETIPKEQPITIQSTPNPEQSILKKMTEQNPDPLDEAMQETGIEIDEEPADYEELPEEDDVIYLDHDEDDQIRHEYKSRNANEEIYKSQTELLIEKRQKLLELMKSFPDITKGLKLTPNKVFKMKSVEDVDNCILNFRSTDSINTATSLIHQGIIALSGVIESAFTRMNRFFLLQDYQQVVASDPEIKIIAREMAAKHSEVLAPYVTPEVRLIVQMGKDGFATHSYNVKRFGIQQLVSPTTAETVQVSEEAHTQSDQSNIQVQQMGVSSTRLPTVKVDTNNPPPPIDGASFGY